MKRKVRVKSLPKAQTGLQAPMVLTPEQKAIWLKNQGMFGADYILDTPKVFDNSPSFKLGEPKVFDNPSVNPFNKSPKLSLYPRNTKFESGILSTGDAIKKINLDKKVFLIREVFFHQIVVKILGHINLHPKLDLEALLLQN